MKLLLRPVLAFASIPFRRPGIRPGAPLLVLAALCFGSPPAQSAVAEVWVSRFNNVVSNSWDVATKVARDAAGDIIVTGRSQADALTVKYSGADGSVLWQKRSDRTANRDDSIGVNTMAVDAKGNVVVTGYAQAATGNAPDLYTAKYAVADGALLWEKRYNGPADNYDQGDAVAVDGSGNVVVEGRSARSGSGYFTYDWDYYTAKYSSADGAVLWEKRHSVTNGWASALSVDGSGNVVVTESADSGIYTAKYAAADGALLWEKRYHGPGDGIDQPRAVAIDASGNVIVLGRSFDEDGSQDFYTAKYRGVDGALLWEQHYVSPEYRFTEARALALDGSGNVVVTGVSDYQFYTAKYAAADGALLWEQKFQNPANGWNAANVVAVDASGNVVVTGDAYNGNNFDCYTAKYAAADGALIWEKRYNDGGSDTTEWLFSAPYPYSVAIDSMGNVVVTGSSNNGSGSGTDYNTVKYRGRDGALLWEKRSDGGLVNLHDLAKMAAVDSGGNVVVGGTSRSMQPDTGVGPSTDYYTAKYAAATGALLWERRYQTAASDYRNNRLEAVAVDSWGDVVVTGSAFGAGTRPSDDYYTAKYASADGALLWERRYDGPAKLGDNAYALAVDGSGNVVVTGQSASRRVQGSDVHDIYTAKYASADGELLWEKRYNGPHNLDDAGRAVALDGTGNVIVSGISARSGSSEIGWTYDGYTAKYAAINGALVWEKRIGGTMAVDKDGNVLLAGHLENRTDPDYYLAKYAAADGALVWETRTSGVAVKMVTTDSSGNIALTGFFDRGTVGSVNLDYFTAKYAAADGVLLWDQRYNGPANLEDIPVALAMDGNGNVVVTGSSATSGSRTSGFKSDYYTAKYAAKNGALLWEMRYNSPANGDDSASSLALGPNGMVVVTGSSTGFDYSLAYPSYDYATVVYREPLPPVAIELIPAGIRLRFTGTPGRAYTIERATSSTGPWSTINIPTAPASGLIEYLDTLPPSDSGFYRFVQR